MKRNEERISTIGQRIGCGWNGLARTANFIGRCIGMPPLERARVLSEFWICDQVTQVQLRLLQVHYHLLLRQKVEPKGDHDQSRCPSRTGPHAQATETGAPALIVDIHRTLDLTDPPSGKSNCT